MHPAWPRTWFRCHGVELLALVSLWICAATLHGATTRPPNVLLIYADDLGYGDLGCYGAKRVKTPAVDRLARAGLRFTDAHTTSATCTPSRYGLLTGHYPWRRRGTGVLPGDAALIIEPGRTTLASVLQKAGYSTGVVGKWHLGLGAGSVNWNAEIRPGPSEIGFGYHFIMAATGDRVPCVYVENQRVVGLDPADPIEVSYSKPFDGEPTGRKNPELLKLHPSHGHDMALVNGISRIGYMRGGKNARWVDEDMADVFTRQAVRFLEQHRTQPFFLFFATQDIHVPRVPHPRFAGATEMGPRGDAIAQFDHCVGELLKTLDRLNLAENTLVILTGDNGPVVDDGYQDRAMPGLGSHRPAGPWRGGKYSNFEGGTRVPFIVRWPGRIRKGVTPALFSQVDLVATLAALTSQELKPDEAVDSLNALPALMGRDRRGRDHLVAQAGSLSVRMGSWKYIEAGSGNAFNVATATETGNSRQVQLYDLSTDSGEMKNVAVENPVRVEELSAKLRSLREAGRTR